MILGHFTVISALGKNRKCKTKVIDFTYGFGIVD